MIDLEKLKPKIAEVAKKRNLSLVVLYGSQAKETAREKSDIDIAVLGKKPISFDEHIDLINDFTDILRTDDVDVKPLNKATPFFRYQAMKDGILLYGNVHEFNLYKLYAIRIFQESFKLRKLKEYIIKKRLEDLKEAYA